MGRYKLRKYENITVHLEYRIDHMKVIFHGNRILHRVIESICEPPDCKWIGIIIIHFFLLRWTIFDFDQKNMSEQRHQ